MSTQRPRHPALSPEARCCLWTWPDQTPATDYEFQVAAWSRAEQLRQPQLLQWTPSVHVTTLDAPRAVRAERAGDPP